MESIKFRAWDNKNKSWLLDYETMGGFSLFGEVMLFELWSGVINRFIVQQKDRIPDDLILTQYSTKKDKNDKEIYAGDIMYQKYVDKYEESGFGEIFVEIVFKDAAFGWIGEVTNKFFSFEDQPLNDYEVVGNIFQNAELISKK